jgi:hypothetical protein
MVSALVALPVFSMLVIFQSTVVSRFPLLHGSADLVLLVIIAWALQEQVDSAWVWALLGGLLIGFSSAVSIFIPLIVYLTSNALALMTRRRIWQIPILGMFAVTLIGTLLSHGLTALTISISGTALPWLDVFQLITLPSLFLNILLAAPIYAIVKDFASWLHPEEIKI